MQKRYFLIIFIILFAGAIWGLVTSIQSGKLAKEVATEQGSTPVETTPVVTAPAQKDDLIVVNAPLANQKISSPVTITGQARGNWFFEASFPIEITTEDGTVIGKGIGQAKGDWMTTEYVPFSATITFTKPTSATTGYIVLRKDNPSGEARFDNALSIKVQL